MSAAAVPPVRRGQTRDGRVYVVRPGVEPDAEALLELRDAVAAEGRWVATEPGDRSLLEHRLATAAILSQGGLLLVAEVGGRVVGEVTAWRRPDPRRAHVAEVAIAVHRDHRRHGLGRALLGAAIEWARDAGLTKLALAVFPDNEPAVALYRGLGFREEGLQHGELRLGGRDRDLLLMALPLR